MQESSFDIIVGRHHSGRTRQALSMAAAKAQRDKRTMVVIGPHLNIEEGGFIFNAAKEIADLFEVRCELEDYNRCRSCAANPNKYVFCVLADEISVEAQQQKNLRDLLDTLALYKQEVVVSTPSLLGLRNDLRLSSEARAIINCTPEGSRIHLTTVNNNATSWKDKLKIDLVGYRMPFNI